LLDQQTTDIANVAKDVKALQNQNFWLKMGIGAAVIVGIAGVVYGLAK
jgi:hypothetical protein